MYKCINFGAKNLLIKNLHTKLDSVSKLSVNRAAKRERENIMKSVTKEVLALKDKSIEALRLQWKRLFHTEPPPYSRDYFIPRLAYRIQELAYGGLPKEYAKKLDSLADAMEKSKPLQIQSDMPRIGTKLVRTYKGVMYEVSITDNGFVYAGQHYKSLSAIARKITGTRWNGKVFFGVKNGR